MLVSSHLMSVMAVTAEHLVIVGRGRLLADTTVDELIARVAVDGVVVRSPHATELAELLVSRGARVTSDEPGTLLVSGVATEMVSALAADHRFPLHELTPQRASLEQAYMELTREAVEFRDIELHDVESSDYERTAR